MTTLLLKGLDVVLAGQMILTNVDMKCERGEIRGLIGPNGAGKTTLVNTVTGYIAPSAGEVTLDGRSIRGRSPDAIARAGIRRTFQHPEIWATLTPRQHLAAVLVKGSERPLVGVKVARRLLDSIPDRPAVRLDLYDQRLLEFARAAMGSPSVMLLDEPAAGLDEGQRESVGELIRVMADGGVAIVVIEHDMRFLQALVDNVTVLESGSVLADGTKKIVYEDPAVSRAYLGGV